MAGGRTLQVQYTTQDAFRAEYASNISRGGIFVATTDDVHVRDIIEVELALLFCDQFLVLEGEIVHLVPPEMEAAGATPGVAVQFVLPVKELRGRLGEFAGEAGSPDERVRKTGRRAAPRSRARVSATVDRGDQGPILGQTRDVSASGLLLEVQGEPVPIGETIELTLDHPVSGEKMRIQGRVVRHVTSSRGLVTAMGVELANSDARQTEVASFMSDLQASEHSRRLGAINGPIADLGISDLLQMFASTMQRGTLSVLSDDAAGSIGFESNHLLWAEIDGLHGQPALETMLALRSGHFELETRLVEPLCGADEPIPLEGAILSALCALDESKHASESKARAAQPSAQSSAKARAAQASAQSSAKARAAQASAQSSAKAGKAEPASGAKPAKDRKVAKPATLPNAVKLVKVAKTAAAPGAPSRPVGVAGRTSPTATFRVDPDALEECRTELDQTESAVVDLALVGMSVDKMLEVIPEPEIGVLIAIDTLVARGVLDVAGTTE